MTLCPLSIHCFLPAGHDGRCRDNAYTADGYSLDPYHLRLVIQDGKEVMLGRCPGCGVMGELDDDQLHGRVSTHHEDCGYHETKNWWADHAAADEPQEDDHG